MAPRNTPPFRAEHVGSLLRPTELLEARAARAAGRLEPDALRAAEDQAILGALALQREVGLDVYSDGEFRRDAWMSDLAEAVEGFVPERVPMQWRGPGGGIPGEAGPPARWPTGPHRPHHNRSATASPLISPASGRPRTTAWIAFNPG